MPTLRGFSSSGPVMNSYTAGYTKIAKTVCGLPEHSREIDGALRIVGQCLDPLLGRHLDRGTWNPIKSNWSMS